MKKIKLFILNAAVAIALLVHQSGIAQTKMPVHFIRNVQIGGTGGWDYVTVDGPAKRIYVSHATQVHILNTKGDSLGVITGMNGVHGIALAQPNGKGYISAGRDNNCVIFDLQTLKVIGKIPVGTNPDAIFYDVHSKKVYCFNGRSQDASVIDPATDKVVATIPLGGKPETGVSDLKGQVYVNSETTNEVLVIDTKTDKVTRRYKINGGEEPSGLAIDPATMRLFIGCGGNQTMIIMNAANGNQLARFAIGDCDGVAFDAQRKLAYSSNGEGTLSVIREVSAGKFLDLGKLPTESSARTIGLDLTTHRVFLPAAKTEPAQPTAENAHPRPKAIPGTFHLIEIGG